MNKKNGFEGHKLVLKGLLCQIKITKPHHIFRPIHFTAPILENKDAMRFQEVNNWLDLIFSTF